ncbi:MULTISPECIES: aminodeoxychorismate/anthranilate synthase component II [unclassified Pseudodesulfovibrio]|uniref:aminodeoxychorismate/anthranilate synthase component II n=1 Tax=unclassified Pseudodesulfovibrio TaxID=2661612 RepID=UPI000FEBA943|nr:MULTISPECIES: aminodeoxychorismate/anthranilate synthase component II [unclassified Pseudodesulfovibrio]MCJ2165133.1 aminodeoxychorismate/anthranilate synthase component II [Pseudodesulfovibrio sp. S3-i]RWU03457.1 aminodeoxychorismate/anthranilate synthase component II [Pseudodesulfovibrio sp. S3]
MKILLIDNNDSFTRNLEHLLVAAVNKAVVTVVPYASLPALPLDEQDLIVISPGPGDPAEYPGYDRIFAAGVPVLGVCLGMQIINRHFDGCTGKLAGCVHGKTDVVQLNGREHVVARYHSLHVVKTGQGLDVLASNADGVVMCLGSRQKHVLGFQFHPESFLSPDGGWFIAYALDYLALD